MLTVQAIQFRCTLINDATLPPYKGSTLRGAFGCALKQVVCALRARECPACLLAARCLYPRFFESGAGRDGASPLPAQPHPYLIEPEPSQRTHYSAGDSFSFTMLLFGEFVEALPYCIYAVEIMGENGLGKRSGAHRGRFALSEATRDGAVIYSAKNRRLAAIPPARELPPPLPGPAENGKLTVTLMTPLRLKNGNRLTDELSFQALIRAALRRVAAMHSAYGDGDPPLDYRTLIAGAANVKTTESSLAWRDWKRYSNRQRDEMLLGGLIGNISFVGNLGPFMQIMEQARLMHIGKQTTFGLGAFDYRWEPENQ